MRELFEVVEKMLPLVPKDKTDFIQALESIKVSAAFAPPELMHFWWKSCAEVLYDHIPDDPEPNGEDWEKELVKIWQDKP